MCPSCPQTCQPSHLRCSEVARLALRAQDTLKWQKFEDCLQYICIVSRYKDYTFDYDDMAGYLHYIQLQFSIGPSEGSWRSKETYFQNQRTLIHRIFSVKTKLSDPFPKEWYLYFHSLCSICHKKLCIFLPKRKKMG